MTASVTSSQCAALAFAAVLLCPAPAAMAADYPAKPIRFVVPSSPGGGADVLGRSIALRLADGLGKPVVVENRSGAGGIIGYEIVAGVGTTSYLSAEIFKTMPGFEVNNC